MEEESTPLSQIIHADAMLSPLETAATWDLFPPAQEPFPCSYGQPAPQHPQLFQYPPSSPSSFSSSATDSPGSSTSSGIRMLRLSPDTPDADQQLCVPTSQLFDFPQQASISSSASSPISPLEQDHHYQVTLKRSASPEAVSSQITTKKKNGERVTTKDFVPPDVSGLSKREARLVKNRAAAFLSRQRKREEFEAMEVRVAELERENARLLSLAQNGSDKLVPGGILPNDAALRAEVDRLRARLTEAEARERGAGAGAAFGPSSRHASHDAPVKMEPLDVSFNSQTGRSSAMPSPHTTGVGLGLMQVLLCALPALLRAYGGTSAPPSHIDLGSILTPELNWHRQGDAVVLDLDVDDQGRPRSLAANPALAAVRRLELSGSMASAIVGLGGRELAFAAGPSEGGKIRVRVSPPSPAPSDAFAAPRSPMTLDGAMSAPLLSSPVWPPSLDALSMPAVFSAGTSDPFFGMGQGDYGMSYPMMCPTDLGPTVFSPTEPTFASALSSDLQVMAAAEDPSHRQMQIALKAAGEPDWGAQFC
ncbi:hypothetical protein HDZ31DRAFT_37256 [Schizophyllum fasciatum]